MANAKALTIIKKNNGNIYLWQGVDAAGKKLKGELPAASMTAVKILLRKQGIYPKKIHKKREVLLSQFTNRIKNKDITYFTRQLATMVKAGIPLVQALIIISKGVENKKLATLIDHIRVDLEGGQPFHECLFKHPKYFSGLYCNLVLAGEQAGALDTILSRLASYREKTQSLKSKVKKAIFYPLAVIIVAIVVTSVLLIYVVPQFETIFKNFNAQLPYLTQMIIALSKFMQSYWWILSGAILGGILLCVRMKKKSTSFNLWIQKLSLKLPIFGAILEKTAIARFARTLATTFSAGVPIVDGLESISKASGNVCFADATLQISQDISRGRQINDAMRKTGLFPEMVLQMVTIGEESGTLEDMLTKVSDIFEEEVSNAVDSMSTLIEPVIMAILGGLVGVLLLAMYLPIFQLGNVV